MKNRRIKKSSSSQFTSARHAHFHTQVYGMVAEYGFDKVHVPIELSIEWKRNIDIEADLNNQSFAHTETSQLNEYDHKRDELLYFFFGAIRNGLRSPEAKFKSASEALTSLLYPYKDLQGQARDRKTAQIEGLIIDMRKDENSAHMDTLALRSTVDMLEGVNKAYQKLKNSLTRKKATKPEESPDDVRRRTNTCYEQVADMIYASYLLETDITRKEEIGRLIDALNQFIEEQKIAYKQSQAQKTREKKK